jgi:cell wall-associated NlpC family hydrolase
MSDETAQRAAVAAAARKWLLTPYHVEADIMGAGVDCGMLIVRVFVDLGLVPPFDPRPYPPDWHLHNSDEKYLGWVRQWCAQVDKPAPGDLALFRFGRCFSHGGIVTQATPIALVHAFRDVGCVIEDRFDQNPALTKPGRAPVFYSLWAKKKGAT